MAWKSRHICQATSVRAQSCGSMVQRRHSRIFYAVPASCKDMPELCLHAHQIPVRKSQCSDPGDVGTIGIMRTRKRTSVPVALFPSRSTDRRSRLLLTASPLLLSHTPYLLLFLLRAVLSVNILSLHSAGVVKVRKPEAHSLGKGSMRVVQRKE